MVYRRFGYIQARLLLEKQEDLRSLEQELENFDKELAATDERYLQKRNLPQSLAGPRQELMEKLEAKFCEYGKLLTTAHELVALNRPAASDYKSVENYIYNNHPLIKREEDWIVCKEDLITLRPGREHAWLDFGIEHLLKWMRCPLIEYIFCSDETKEKSGDNGDEKYFTRSRIDRLVLTIITGMILMLLIVPVYILYHLVEKTGNKTTDAKCIGTLLIFTLLFSAALSLFTRAKRHEILGAAAAYCAVLVVFLGNVGNTQIG